MSRQRPRKPRRASRAVLVVASAAALCAIGSASAQQQPRPWSGARSTFENNTAIEICSRAAAQGDVSDTAVEACQQARESRLTFNDRIATLINSGVVHLRRGEFDRAIGFYDQVLAQEPDHAIAMFNRGAAMVHAGRYAESVSSLTQSLTLGVAEPHKAYYYRGAARRALGDLRGAREDFRSALAIAPDFPPAATGLSEVEAELNPSQSIDLTPR
ncbi:MAG: tetratricopeptide repeat protein [Alphaproteobacteria bacterium]|nr:tetratricopeptide repeat protein [Alphaproteobacteria bacterium]